MRHPVSFSSGLSRKKVRDYDFQLGYLPLFDPDVPNGHLPVDGRIDQRFNRLRPASAKLDRRITPQSQKPL